MRPAEWRIRACMNAYDGLSGNWRIIPTSKGLISNVLTKYRIWRCDPWLTWLFGRYDNLINTGGVKVAPEVVEAAIANITGLEAVIVGLPDRILGRKVVLALEKRDRAVSLDELRKSLRNAIPKHARPKEIRYVDRFPRNRSFKVDRIGLIKRLEG